MQWLMTSHVRRHHRRYGGSGHVWGGRFKAFPAQGDWHLLSVLRYIERNPLRAGLVDRAQDWTWSSLHRRLAPSPPAYLDPGPVPRPQDWLEWVHQPQSQEELDAIRLSIARGRPWGQEPWVRQIASQLDLESSLRSRGRPKNEKK
jgi:putative transposase